MHRRVRRPRKHKDANRHQDRPQDGRRQPKLGLAAARHASLLRQLRNQPAADTVPHRVRQYADDHAYSEAQEGQADLVRLKAVVLAKDDAKGAEEDVQDAQQKGAEDVEEEAHGLEHEQLEGPLQGDEHGLEDGLLHLFVGSEPAVVAGLLADLAGLVSEQYRVYKSIILETLHCTNLVHIVNYLPLHITIILQAKCRENESV